MVTPRVGRYTVDSDLAERYIPTPPMWHEHAACRDSDIDFTDEHNERVRAKAMQVCGRCGVMAPCRAVALADPSLVGVWGGTDSAARRAMRRDRKGSNAPT